MILVTGGAGFIGSNFIQHWLRHTHEPVINLDALTYAGSRANLDGLCAPERHRFVQGSIADSALLDELLQRHQPRAVLHLAAQTHVDRSIDDPAVFFETNVLGTQRLLDAVRSYWQRLPAAAARQFRFVQVSTDEVYGSLTPTARAALPSDRLNPSSPYAASKAAADHCVQAYRQTWGLPTVIVRCGNNYGPRQYPEKLVPVVILRHALGGTIPIYGHGRQRRDWVHVDDHCAALRRVLAHGMPGQIYHVASGQSPDNLTLVHQICQIVNALAARATAARIEHVADRPGHDQRYALDTTHTCATLGWQPRWQLEAGLRQTVAWYLRQPPLSGAHATVPSGGREV